jgi:hypothetical protein
MSYHYNNSWGCQQHGDSPEGTLPLLVTPFRMFSSSTLKSYNLHQLFVKKKNIVNQQTIIYKHTLRQIPSPQGREQ